MFVSLNRLTHIDSSHTQKEICLLDLHKGEDRPLMFYDYISPYRVLIFITEVLFNFGVAMVVIVENIIRRIHDQVHLILDW